MPHLSPPVTFKSHLFSVRVRAVCPKNLANRMAIVETVRRPTVRTRHMRRVLPTENDGSNMTTVSSVTAVVLKRDLKYQKVLLLLFLCGVVSSSPIDWAARRFSRGGNKPLDANVDVVRRKESSMQNAQPLVLSTRKTTLASVDSTYYEDVETHESSQQGRMWPPWPFNLLSRPRRGKKHAAASSVQPSSQGGYRSNAQLFWAYFRQSARVGGRQIQQVGSDLWFNLPPAAPPLILLAALPRRVTIGETTSRIPPLFGNAFARNLAVGYVGVAILSWAHSELNRKRRLVPLPLRPQYQDVQRAILPHFLPEEVTLAQIENEVEDAVVEEVLETSTRDEKGQEEDDDEEESMLQKGLSSVPPRLRRQLQNIYDVAPNPQTLRSTAREWGRMRESRKLQEENIRRQAIMDELIALNMLKKNAAKKRKRKSTYDKDDETVVESSTSSSAPLGYALVTGASRGIGRAIAVELARWEIPLILVARDVDRLTVLATEIEKCYGVRCCVLQADLAEPYCAEKIHRATLEAGLPVDILVNNAGICTTGLAVDMPSTDVRQMIQVNAMSVAMLNNLYGRDMKDQGRGRILVVSSVVGCPPAGPQVAVYAATKAFEKNLALSMGKELEPYGVGVTCLMPGAVRNTSFRSKSGSEQALCWSLPGYTRTAPTVAHDAVRAMLSGQTEVCPGWQNRAFVKLMTPMLPQRITSLIVETAWTPPKFNPFGSTRRDHAEQSTTTIEEPGKEEKTRALGASRPEIAMPWFEASPTVPRILSLPADETTDTGPETEGSVDPGTASDAKSESSELSPDLTENVSGQGNPDAGTTPSEGSEPEQRESLGIDLDQELDVGKDTASNETITEDKT